MDRRDVEWLSVRVLPEEIRKGQGSCVDDLCWVSVSPWGYKRRDSQVTAFRKQPGIVLCHLPNGGIQLFEVDGDAHNLEALLEPLHVFRKPEYSATKRPETFSNCHPEQKSGISNAQGHVSGGNSLLVLPGNGVHRASVREGPPVGGSANSSQLKTVVAETTANLRTEPV